MFATVVNGLTQNLVPNPSFEDTLKCPYQQNDHISISVKNWYIASQSGTTGGTSDYFHTCSQIIAPLCNNLSASVPQNCAGYQFPRTGEGYAGFIAYVPILYSLNYKEYIGVKLNETLHSGCEYSVEFYVSLADSCVYAVDEVGAFFGNDSLPQLWVEPLSIIPQIVNPNGIITEKTNWVKISGNFIASGNEKYMFIGSYNNYDDMIIDTIEGGTNGNHILSYYSDSSDNSINFNFDIPNIITPNKDGSNDLFQLNFKFERTEIYNRWGQKLFDSKENGYYWNGQTNGEKQVPDGTYYYIITTEKEIYTGFLQLLR